MFKKSLLLGSSVILSAAIATPAMAQVDDEIIVTATKREQTLQEVPIAVTVTSADTIEKAQILDIKDLQSVVPTLRVSQLQNSANTNFVIRGFGNGANNPGIEPSVGIFIDGVYRSRSAAQIGDLPVLERVETLSGPQSTLFGKNASAGVISVVTKKPSFVQTGYVEAGYGNYNQFILKGAISGPISENLAATISGGLNKRDGYSKSLNPAVDDMNDRNRHNFRADFLYQPTDNIEFRLIGDYNNIDENCCVANLTDLFDSAAPAGLGQSLPGSATFAALTNLGLQINDPNDPYTYTNTLNRESKNKIEDYGVSFQADVDFGAVSLTSITAYRENESFFDSDVDFSNVDFLPSVIGDNDIQTFTQELRLNGTAFNDRAAWTLGGYYFSESIDAGATLSLGNDTRAVFEGLVGQGNRAAGAQTLAGIELATGRPVGTFFAPGLARQTSGKLDNEAYSIFGNVDFDLTDRFTLTLGGNYTEDKKDYSVSQVTTEDFSNLNFRGSDGVQVLTALGLQSNFPAFSASCLNPATGAPFTPLAFSPGNVGAVLGSPACFINPADLSQTVPGSVAFAGFQGQVAAGSAALAPTSANPLLALQALQFIPHFAALPNPFESNNTDDSEFTYTIRGAYDVSDNINVYASYATGFKASSINLGTDARPVLQDYLDANGRPNAAAFASLPNNYTVTTDGGLVVDNTTPDSAIPANAVANPATARNFGSRSADPEETRAIEFGLKAKFEKGAINLAVFDQSIKGFQSNVFIGTGFVLANAGEQTVRGAEFDITYRPIDPLTLTVGGAYLDAKYNDFKGSPNLYSVPTDRSGDEVQGISPYNLAVSATYNHDFENGMSGFLRGDFTYESKTRILDSFNDVDVSGNQVVTDFGNGAIASTTGFANLERETKQFNFGAGLDFDNGFALQAYVRNAFNDERLVSSFPVPGLAGLFFGYPNQPRTYGVVGKFSF